MFYLNGIKTQGPEDWQQGLRKPKLHWKPGYSAWALAHCWETAQGFPPEILKMLALRFPDVHMVEGLVEHKVPMPGKGPDSQNDVFVRACANGENLCIAVEGKVSESLGQTIHEWRDGTPNREARLQGILDLIGLPQEIPDSIRYQLLHRMASPVVEATASGAHHAIMIIHSFSSLDESFGDFAAFLKLYGMAEVQTGKLYHLKTIGGLRLYAGWACGDRRFRSEQAAGEQ